MEHSRMLPGGLLQEPGPIKRTPRDWIVDATMMLCALAIGGLAFFGTVDQHSETMQFWDLVIGALCFIPLWWRRRYPLAVALLTGFPSMISALAAGPALIALFNVALRGSRRAIILCTLLGVAGGMVFALVYPDPDGELWLDV